MIRNYLAAATLLLAAACSKAPEDVTAHYSVANGRGTITVKAAGNGDTRLDAGPQTFIRHGGTDYVVVTEGNDRFAATVPDFVSSMGELIRESGGVPPQQANEPEFEAVQEGEETIAGLKGAVWKVRPKPAAGAQSIDVVVSSDPAFAGVGKAIAMQARFGSAGMQQVAGRVPNIEKKLEEVLDKGMVLRFGDALKLDGVEKAPIAASEFALPKVLDKAALKKHLNEMRQRSMAEAEAMANAAKKRAEEAPAPAPGASPSPAPKAPAN
ncbi:hypothetical protein IAG41_10790 [Sphingomonas sp. JC676]|uniref:hypothetical protein n=1 Tax=Sphingomonas sp. JC676 TaxID=2768065 RepID=UPI001657B080|nr:hypothetical protein [Sphingomonas sp. JC676]MBC9032879.1 hypothetical protein [Sphingomonas sp. JC676]